MYVPVSPFVDCDEFFILEFVGGCRRLVIPAVVVGDACSPFSPVADFLFGSQTADEVFAAVCFPVDAVTRRTVRHRDGENRSGLSL